ncbi:MAG TPA: tail fiber domain-containing protein, partial [Ferruginibacter sp.]|nr:tail fiber domain-containing protein [Ferruginibacter sp.]
ADTGNYNSGLGVYALYRVANGSNNVALGYSAMYSDSSGNLNTAVGNGALYTNKGSHVNNAFGWNALYSYTGTADGYNNAFGDWAGLNLASGTQNVMMGSWAMASHTGGAQNTAIGNFVMGQGTAGNNNTALGAFALLNSSGSSNVSIGHNSGNTITTGSNNTFVGTNANATTGALTNATALGYNASVSQSNSLILGNTSVDVGIGLTAPLTKLHIYENTAANVNLRVASFSTSWEPGIELLKTGAGSDWRIKTATTGNLVFTRSIDDLVTPIDEYEMSSTAFRPFTDNTNSLGLLANRWTTVYAFNGVINTSDARDKENINDLNYGLNEIMKLRPVSYTWKENPQWGKKIGFIAQEVKSVLSEVVQQGELKSKVEARDDQGNAVNKTSDKLGIYYSDIIPVTVKAIQEQQQTIEQQQKQIEELKKTNEQLKKDMELIKAKLSIKN